MKESLQVLKLKVIFKEIMDYIGNYPVPKNVEQKLNNTLDVIKEELDRLNIWDMGY